MIFAALRRYARCNTRYYLVSFLLFVCTHVISQRVVRYDLSVNDTIVNYTAPKKAIAINGSIPAPTLYFTEGDTAEIYVHNLMKRETSIHWHGLVIPNQYDGVPYLTTAPIRGGQTHIYRFAINQNGTYWYHSHTQLQEQSGMYGAIIVHKRNDSAVKEYPLVLSDWTNDKPYEVHRSLHYATDWYAIKKGTTQDYYQAAKEGFLKTKFKNEWKRMLSMDVSDVYYDKFLSNGKDADKQPQYKAGDKVKLRIVNGASSTYFWLQYAGGKITVVASDGKDVEPVDVDRMMIAVAETYDVIVTIPENNSYEFKATAEDRTKSTSLYLGDGMRVEVAALPKLKYFEGMKMMNGMMKMNGKMDDMGMQMSNQSMDMNTVMYPEISGEPKAKKHRRMRDKTRMNEANHSMTDMAIPSSITTLNYAMLRSVDSTSLRDTANRTFRFNLTGNMNRYVWSIDNKTVSEIPKILIKQGDIIRIILYNGTMMRHPMHLHGHFFRVINGQGSHAPLKNVLDIMPMEIDTLEFAATESGDWFFHCHILYHMMSGMGRIFHYENSPSTPEIPNPRYAKRKLFADDRRIHPMGKIDIATNGVDGELMLANTRWKLQTEWRLGYSNMEGYESESHIGRYFGRNQFWFPYIGWDVRYRTGGFGTEVNLFQQRSGKNNRQAACIGIQYTLPMLLIADLRLDMYGKVRFQLHRDDIPLTKRIRISAMANTDGEYMVGFRYIESRYFSFSTHYDSDMGIGAGVTFNY